METTTHDTVTQASELPAWTTPTLTEIHLVNNTLSMSANAADGGFDVNNQAAS